MPNPSQQSGRFTLLTISSLIAISPFAMEAYLPALIEVANDLNASMFDVNLTISLYLVGMGLGQFLGGPISDQIGRRTNVVIGLSVFTLASAGIFFSNDILTIQILRFFQAFGAGFSSVVGLPSIRDIYPAEIAAKKIPTIQSVMLIAPMLAPIIGSLLLFIHWRAIFVFLALYAIVLFYAHGKIVGESRKNTESLSLLKVFTQYKKVVSHRAEGILVAIKYILIAGASSGVFLTLLTHAPWIYLTYYDVSQVALPLYFGIHAASLIFSNMVLSKLLSLYDASHILRASIVLQFFLAIVILGVNHLFKLNLFLYLCFISVVMALGGINNGCVTAMIFGYFDRLSGSAVSLIALTRGVLGGVMATIAGLFLTKTLTPIFMAMLAGCTISVILMLLLPKTTLKEIANQEKLNEF